MLGKRRRNARIRAKTPRFSVWNHGHLGHRRFFWWMLGSTLSCDGIYVYVYMYICIYIYIYTHTHTHTHIYILYVYVCMYIIWVCVCVCVCFCVCVCVCVYTYISSATFYTLSFLDYIHEATHLLTLLTLLTYSLCNIDIYEYIYIYIIYVCRYM